jgi:hypothetical protein
VIADRTRPGPDDDRDLVDAGIGERRHDVVEKRAAERHHPLRAGVGGGGLGRVQPRRRVGTEHPRAAARGKDDGAIDGCRQTPGF